MSEEGSASQKDVEFFSASVHAWYNSSLERDKSLLTLSAGGIGLLITLLTTIGVSSAESLILYLLSIICFIICLFSILFIFNRNRAYIEKILKSKETKSSVDPLLPILDKIALGSFGLGIMLAAILGMGVAFHSFIVSEGKMSKDQDGNHGPIIKSFNGAENLKPTQESTPSVNGNTSQNNQSQNESSSQKKK